MKVYVQTRVTGLQLRESSVTSFKRNQRCVSLMKFLPVLGLLSVALPAHALEKRAAPTVSISSPEATIIGG